MYGLRFFLCGASISGLDVEICILGDFNAAGIRWSTRDFDSEIGFYSKNQAGSLFKFIDLMNLEISCHESSNTFFCNNGLDLTLSNCVISVEEDEGFVPPDKFHAPFSVTISYIETVKADLRNLPSPVVEAITFPFIGKLKMLTGAMLF